MWVQAHVHTRDTHTHGGALVTYVCVLWKKYRDPPRVVFLIRLQSLFNDPFMGLAPLQNKERENGIVHVFFSAASPLNRLKRVNLVNL